MRAAPGGRRKQPILVAAYDGRRSSAHEAAAEAEGDRLRAVVDAELAEQPAGVRLDGVLGEVELAPDGGVRLALRHAGQDLQLALGELRLGRCAADVLAGGEGAA